MSLPPVDSQDPACAKTMAAPAEVVVAPQTDPANAATMALLENRDPEKAPVGKTASELSGKFEERYEILEELGHGGMGRVLLAMDRQMGREVAVKELLPTFVSDGPTLAPDGGGGSYNAMEVRFLTEARVTGNLEHPAIIPVHEIGQRTDGTLYYVMKLVRGKTMQKTLQERDLSGRLALLNRFVEVGYAVAFAHSRGVVHRDLKPENIMIGEFGETVVLDWGLARIRNDFPNGDTSVNRFLARLEADHSVQEVEGMPMGSPQYMAPEQARGEISAINELSDIFMLGGILYEILSGRPPRDGETPTRLVLAAMNEEIVPPEHVAPGVPPELSAIAMRALSLSPQDRYRTVRDLVDDVERFMQGRLVRSYEYSPRELFLRFLRKNRMALAVCMVLVVAMGTVWWIRGANERTRARAAEVARIQNVEHSVRGILDEASRPHRGARWLDLFAFRLVSLREPAVERLLVAHLGHPVPEVRQLVARALGGMKSSLAVEPLMSRLEDTVETDESVIIEVINALGIIGDSRAGKVVHETRWRYGQYSTVWNQTALAFRMIPVLPGMPDKSGSAEEFHELGMQRENRRELDEALAAYQSALERDPDYARSHNNIGNILKRKKEFAKSLWHFNRLIELQPELDIGYINRGLLLNQMGRYDDALLDFNQALKLNPENPATWNNRAITYVNLGDYNKSLEDYEKAAELRPENARYLSNIANSHIYNGDFVSAKKSVEASLLKDSNHMNARIIQVHLHYMEMKYADAMIEINHILSVDPEYFSAYPWKLHLLVLENRLEEAREVLQLVSDLKSIEEYTKITFRALNWHASVDDFSAAMETLRPILAVGAPPDVKRTLSFYHYALQVLSGATNVPMDPDQLTEGTTWPERVLRTLAGRHSLAELSGHAGSASRRQALHLVEGLLLIRRGQSEEARSVFLRATRIPLPLSPEGILARAALRKMDSMEKGEAFRP